MKTLWVVTVVCAASVVAQGCKSNKPEPVPDPKVGSLAVRHAGVVGIAWFQGSVEEAFSKAAAGRRPIGQNQSTSRRWEGPCPDTTPVRRPDPDPSVRSVRRSKALRRLA